MKDTNGKEIIKGARVLLTRPDPSYEIGSLNPLETPGTYIGSNSVHWDNKRHNCYKDDELTIIYNDQYLNVDGLYKSIWENF